MDTPGSRRASAALLLALAMAGAPRPALAAAAEDPGPPAAIEDPRLEAVNRQIHAFNAAAQAQVLGPLAAFYRAQTPPALRRGIAGVAATLREPVTALSGLAAGRTDIARDAAARFAINLTLGWGGTRDRATELGYPSRPFAPADALCAWGVPAGPFLVLPLLGPATLRDAGGGLAAGLALSLALGPDVTAGWTAADAFIGYAEAGAWLAHADAFALDAYAAARNAYRQRRLRACPQDAAAVAE
jgi:phospholipid-binding lipoprotein MlaA